MGFVSGVRGFVDGFRNAKVGARYQMVEDRGNGFYTWNGKMYQSDLVRACIKPKTKAIGKAVAKHIRKTVKADGTTDLKVNPETYIRFLLEDPNPLMSGQMLQEKVANQLALNSNAFILIIRDENGYPIELYPVPCVSAEAIYYNNELYLKFYYRNGKNGTFPYSDIIHIRDDYFDNDVFGEPPGKALADLMNCVGTIDQGLVKAIKNSGVVRWLLKYTNSMRPEDLKRNVKEFADTYLSVESDTFGAAGVDSKADIQRVEPKDYVPNAMIINNITQRVYAFFHVNDKIIHSNYNEDEWVSYYEQCIEPDIMQMSNEYTRKLFTRKERAFGNKIVFEADNLTYASMQTKLQMAALLDRGTFCNNEVREYFNKGPIPGGEIYLLRKDTGKLVEGGDGNEED